MESLLVDKILLDALNFSVAHRDYNAKRLIEIYHEGLNLKVKNRQNKIIKVVKVLITKTET